MVLSLLFGRKYAQGKVGTISFDSLLTEEHRFVSKVTSYPVESGAIISDHVINQPDIVSLSGRVTDTLNIFSSFNRSIDAFNKLVDLHRSRAAVSVVTGIKIYDEMVITSLRVPRDVRTGQALDFYIELQNIRYSNNVNFATSSNVFSEQYISDASKIPFQGGPRVLKDQIASQVDAGYQSLQIVATSFLTSVGLA